jgi:uncharacterized protein (TIGR03086 family)
VIALRSFSELGVLQRRGIPFAEQNNKGVHMSTAPYEQAIASTRAVLAAVGPDQLGDDTPCASWKVSDIVNHVVGGQYFFRAAMDGEAPAGEPPDFASGDFLARFDEGSAGAVASFQSDGAMDRTVTLPFGQMPGSAFLGLAATDTFVHGWDIAKATGQSTDLAPELATQLLAAARTTIQDAFRGPDGAAPFGPTRQPPDGASAADQLAAFLGRTV